MPRPSEGINNIEVHISIPVTNSLYNSLTGILKNMFIGEMLHTYFIALIV